MALILPKGIVKNSPEIEGQIERINAEPLDLADIAKFWKVYTTTKRRLLDPTAERLENYWWRIWGSRRRELNGATVARLFAFISDGQSFVPLRGPPNRDEGTTPPLNKATRHGPGAASTTALHHPTQSRPSTTSNVSKAPALPPILKKNKGPSLSSTTRTARFISPHESEVETNTNSPTRSISPNSHVVVKPPSPDSRNSKEDKKVAGTGSNKKTGFVASTASKKKRPMISRRQSSQSSTEQNAIGSSLEMTPPVAEDPRNKGKAPSRFQENFSPDQLGSQSPRKPTTRRSEKGKEALNRPTSHRDSSSANPDTQHDRGPVPSKLRSIENRQAVLAENLTEEELNELELQHTLLEEAKARVDQIGHRDEDCQKFVRSSSGNESSQKDLGAIRLLPHDAKGTAQVAVASTEVTGRLELNDSTTSLPQVADAKGRGKGKGKGKGWNPDIPTPDLFAKRPVPPISATTSAPVPTTSDSLARSKSQLTLLLEKDRARSTDKSTDGQNG